MTFELRDSRVGLAPGFGFSWKAPARVATVLFQLLEVTGKAMLSLCQTKSTEAPRRQQCATGRRAVDSLGSCGGTSDTRAPCCPAADFSPRPWCETSAGLA